MTGGLAETVTDEEILRMQRDLARKEGIGVEPASAASVAGIRKLVENGMIDRNEKIVCVVTGHLLKDPDTVIKQCEPRPRNRRDLLRCSLRCTCNSAGGSSCGVHYRQITRFYLMELHTMLLLRSLTQTGMSLPELVFLVRRLPSMLAM